MNNIFDFSDQVPQKTICPIYFEDHKFGGNVASIETFTGAHFETVRTTFINGRPYFCAIDLCKGLFINPSTSKEIANEAVSDLKTYFFERKVAGPIESVGALLEYSENELYYYINIEVPHKVNQHSDTIINQIISVMFVSEPVVYMMLFRSRKREAVLFKAWLSLEILPGLRMVGREGAEALVKSEAMKMMDTLKEINNNYESIKNMLAENNNIVAYIYQTEMEKKNQDDFNAKILNDKVNTLIFGTSNFSMDAMNSLETLNNKVSNIASGLSTVFGR